MLLLTERLTKNYGTQRALDGLDLAVPAGEIFGLLGPNGSGKSTALRLILGFMKPSAGRAAIEGHDCWTDSVAARCRVAYLPGELRLYENMSGRDLIRFLGRLRGQAHEAEAERLSRRFDIDLARPIAQLSSGMKRKVALLQVLVAEVPLLVLDEPTNTLDPTMRDQLLGLLRESQSRGQAVLFSSHVLGEVEQVCDRVGILRLGRLVHVETMRQLRQGKLIDVRFGQAAPPTPELVGLSLRDRRGDRLMLEYTGPLPALLTWLATQPVQDLRLEPLGLGTVYRHYHGADA